MSYILDIAGVVPAHTIEKEDLERFYSDVVKPEDKTHFLKKLSFLNRRTTIKRRHSSIPDYNGVDYELYKNGDYKASVEDRMKLYKEKIVPLASAAIDKVFEQSGVRATDVTHLITVSCTGICAPGIEFLLADKYDFSTVEKTAVNFLGCYAAMKALKQAHYISETNPKACVLIVCAELCSLHFYPSCEDEHIIANLLFSDGAAATLVCGEKSELVKNRTVLKIGALGSACIPNTADLMTWNISSSAFRMFLSPEIVSSIKNNIQPAIKNFLKKETVIEHWAIHPGGVKIVEAVQQALNLNNEDVEESLNILQNYGNMSSPTILFILEKILAKIRSNNHSPNEKIFSCAFGPGVNVEMILMSSVNPNPQSPLTGLKNAIQA